MENNTYIIEEKGQKFIFANDIPKSKSISIAKEIVDFFERNSLVLSEVEQQVYEGILSCSVKLINFTSGIEVVLPDENNRFSK